MDIGVPQKSFQMRFVHGVSERRSLFLMIAFSSSKHSPQSKVFKYIITPTTRHSTAASSTFALFIAQLFRPAQPAAQNSPIQLTFNCNRKEANLALTRLSVNVRHLEHWLTAPPGRVISRNASWDERLLSKASKLCRDLCKLSGQ